MYVFTEKKIGPAHEISILIAYAQTSLNAQIDLSSSVRSLNFGPSLHQHSYLGMWATKVQASQPISAGSPVPLSPDNGISTKISCAGSIVIRLPCILEIFRAKSGNVGHWENLDIHLKTVEIQMRWLHMSPLIRIFTVCFVNLFLYSKN